MVSAAATARRLSGTAAARIGGRLLAAGLVIVLALRLWQLWRRDPVDFAKVDGGIFALAVLASAASVTSFGLVWPYILRRLGSDAPSSWIAIFFKSQLGKYLPGSVWQYAGRVTLANNRGVPLQRALVSVVAEVLLSAIAAGLVGVLVLGPATAGIAYGGIVALGVAGLASRHRLAAAARRLVPLAPVRARLDQQNLATAARAAPRTGGLYLLVWGGYGLAFWLTARALFAVPVAQLPRYVSVFAISWLVGLVVVFAPGGVGVREAMIVALLHDRLGEENALVLAAASRIVLTAVDLVAGVMSLSLPPLLRRESPKPVQARR